MQAVNNEQSVELSTPIEIKISAEVVAYTLLIIVALVLRFANLGAVPMSDVEAIQALPAYHAVNVEAAGMPQAQQSVITFWLQKASFTAFGGTEYASRISGVMGGMILMLMPLLFRSRFGTSSTFLLSLIFAVSPVAFAAARFSDPVIWTMVFAVGVLWAAWNYWDSRTLKDALWLAVVLAAMICLTESGGLLFALVLVLSAIGTVAWTVYTAPDDLDSTGEDVLQAVREVIDTFPMKQGLLAFVGVVAVASTGALFYPAGLSIVGEALSQTFTGFVRPYVADAPLMFGLLSFLTYESILGVFALTSTVLLVSARNDTVIDRFAIVWALVAFAILLIYRGSKPAFALWIVLPSAYLTMRLVSELLVNYMPSFLSLDEYYSDDPNDYAWIKWLISIAVLAISIMLALHLSQIGRGLLDFPVGESLTSLFDSRFILFRGSIIWFVISLMITIVAYFLAASFWGNRSAVQGFGLGFFGFMLLISIGTGWNTAVENSDNPAELWHTTAISSDAYFLRQTLFEVSTRETRGFPKIPITILLDEAAGVHDDGLIAWLVRDFENARFVASIADVKQDEIVLLPFMEEDPDLGGSYVGQSFAIRQYGADLGLIDWLSWFTQRETRRFTLPEDTTVLWLRMDVYEVVPPDDSARG